MEQPKRIPPPLDKNIFTQLAGYALVAFAGFGADYLLLTLFSSALGLHYLLAAPPAFLAGLAVNYCLGRLLVFSASSLGRGLELGAFMLVSLAALAITEGSMYLLTEALGLHYLLSKVFTGAITFLWNFLARRYLLYRKSKRERSGHHA